MNVYAFDGDVLMLKGSVNLTTNVDSVKWHPTNDIMTIRTLESRSRRCSTKRQQPSKPETDSRNTLLHSMKRA